MDRRTDGRTDGVKLIYPPQQLCCCLQNFSYFFQAPICWVLSLAGKVFKKQFVGSQFDFCFIYSGFPSKNYDVWVVCETAAILSQWGDELTCWINSLRSSDARWCDWSWSSLSQMMACPLLGAKPHMEECWLSVNTHSGIYIWNCPSANGLSPVWHQTTVWINVDLLSVGPLGTNLNEIQMKIQTFSGMQMHLKLLSAKVRPLCVGLIVLIMLIHYGWMMHRCVSEQGHHWCR